MSVYVKEKFILGWGCLVVLLGGISIAILVGIDFVLIVFLVVAVNFWVGVFGVVGDVLLNRVGFVVGASDECVVDKFIYGVEFVYKWGDSFDIIRNIFL